MPTLGKPRSEDRIGDTEGEFSVAQFFSDGTNEYVRRWVSPKEAVIAAKSYTQSVGARCGTTVKVIITDGGDCTNFEWQYGKGVTYPPRANQ